VVDDIERDMLASEDAGELERLRREREHALRVVAQAEQRESAERERLRNLPLTPAALEALWGTQWSGPLFFGLRKTGGGT
jgi:hypothetical protein